MSAYQNHMNRRRAARNFAIAMQCAAITFSGLIMLAAVFVTFASAA